MLFSFKPNFLIVWSKHHHQHDKGCAIFFFDILVSLTLLALQILLMQFFRYLDMLNSMNVVDLFIFLTSYRWFSEHPAPQISIRLEPLKVVHNIPKHFLLCTSLTLCIWHMKYRFLHILLQLAQRRRITLVNPRKMLRSKKLKMKKKSQAKYMLATIVESILCVKKV